MDFYQEFKKLVSIKPNCMQNSRTVENCDYGDYLLQSKNIYLSYFCADAEDCFYCEHLSKCRDCVDCAYVSGGELMYECVDCSGIYNGSFLQDCHNSANCEYCFDCINCKDCFGCFGLRHKKFSVFNKSYTEDNYKRKVAELRKQPSRKILEILLPEFQRTPRLHARQLKGGERSFGDYIYFSKNCFQCFNIRNVQDSAYVTDILDPEIPTTDCVDCDYCSGVTQCYDAFNSFSCTNCDFIYSCCNCSDSKYLKNCYNCQNCYGCVYLTNKQYCVLNRQFSREEYLAAVKKIEGDLKKAGTIGRTFAIIQPT